MNLFQLSQIVSESIAAVGIVAAGLGYFWGQVIAGKNKATKEDYNLLLTRIQALQNTCDAQQRELAQLHQELGKLQGINDEKDKKITELTGLLQNRDPALLEYMKFARDSINEFKQDFRKVNDYMESIDSKLNSAITGGKIQ